MSATVVAKTARERVVVDLELRDGLVLVGGHRDEFCIREHVTCHVTGGVMVEVAALVAGEQGECATDVSRLDDEHSRTVLAQRTHDQLHSNQRQWQGQI